MSCRIYRDPPRKSSHIPFILALCVQKFDKYVNIHSARKPLNFPSTVERINDIQWHSRYSRPRNRQCTMHSFRTLIPCCSVVVKAVRLGFRLSSSTASKLKKKISFPLKTPLVLRLSCRTARTRGGVDIMVWWSWIMTSTCLSAFGNAQNHGNRGCVLTVYHIIIYHTPTDGTVKSKPIQIKCFNI